MPLPITLSIDKGICMLQEKIGLRSGFFSALYDEDDWSFVIKLHALLEAACTHLLMFHFREPELNDVISRLELSGRTVGKTVFLGKLGLLGKEYRRFLSLRSPSCEMILFTTFATRSSACVSLCNRSIRSPFETSPCRGAWRLFWHYKSRGGSPGDSGGAATVDASNGDRQSVMG